MPGGAARRSRAAARRAAGLDTSAVLFRSHVRSLTNSFPLYFSVTAFVVETPSRCGASAVFQPQRAPFRRGTDEHTRHPWRPRAERRGTQQPPRGGQRHRAALRRLLPPRHAGPGARLPSGFRTALPPRAQRQLCSRHPAAQSDKEKIFRLRTQVLATLFRSRIDTAQKLDKSGDRNRSHTL